MSLTSAARGSLALSLEQWNAYETAHPDTFASMYQFWLRKP